MVPIQCGSANQTEEKAGSSPDKRLGIFHRVSGCPWSRDSAPHLCQSRKFGLQTTRAASSPTAVLPALRKSDARGPGYELPPAAGWLLFPAPATVCNYPIFLFAYLLFAIGKLAVS